MMSSGTQISDMTLQTALPNGSFAPFVVTSTSGGLSPLLNYRFDMSLLGSGVNAMAMGATGGGVINDTVLVQLALNAVPSGGLFVFPAGKSFLLGSLNLNGKTIFIDATGATIIGTGAAAMVKTDHGHPLWIKGGTWTGTQGLRWIAATTDNHGLELSIDGAVFATTDYNIYMDGVREATFNQCDFTGDWEGSGALGGVYRTRSANHTFTACNWKNCNKGIFDDGAASPYSAGIRIIGGQALGCNYGYHGIETDGGCMIGFYSDFNDHPVRLEGVEIFGIIGGYYSSRTVNPAIFVGKSGAVSCTAIRIEADAVRTSYTGGASNCIQLDTVISCYIRCQEIGFYRGVGIAYQACVDLTITGSTFNGINAVATNCILETGTTNSATNRIVNNAMGFPTGSTAISVGAGTSISGNRQYTTFNSAQSAILLGNTDATITHGLNYTPLPQDIVLTPTSSEAATKGIYINGAPGSTTFTVTMTSAAAADSAFSWSIRKSAPLA